MTLSLIHIYCEEETGEANILKTPKQPVLCPGSFASAEAVAHIMTQKFVMYSPLYRMEPVSYTHLDVYKRQIQNVCGNCDGFTETPDQRILRVEGKRILMMHGHRYNVKLTYASAAYAAREAEADILLFGHTHIPYCEQVDDLWMLNPGSCGGRGATYGVISLENREVMCYTVGIAPER